MLHRSEEARQQNVPKAQVWRIWGSEPLGLPTLTAAPFKVKEALLDGN